MGKVGSQTKRFIVAAKVAKLHAFEQLAINCKLVTKVCNIVHELQKERGVSNVYLASSAEHFSEQRIFQLSQTQIAESELSSFLKNNFLEAQLKKDNHRLLLAISLSLQSIDELESLRLKVMQHKLSPLHNTQAYCRLITSLLDIIYEAADTENDENIAKGLIALFNFLQAKEYAGQERAWGAIGFADKHFTPDICKRLHELQDAQQQSLDVFVNFACSELSDDWLVREKQGLNEQLKQLRKMIAQLADGSTISSEISEVWYDVATQRIEAMHFIEQALIDKVLSMAQNAILTIAKELKEGINVVTKDNTNMIEDGHFEALAQNNLENRLLHGENRSVYELLDVQTKRIEKIQNELIAAQVALQDQQKVSRAKLLMMHELKISEDQAHKRLRRTAMDQQVSITDVATKIIAIAAKA